MAEVFSPQVITREIDVSTVAPSVSTSIAAIVGGAVKGPLNEATFVSSPDQFIETFGAPPADNPHLGLTAINFLRNGNQLWVNRVASLSGTDPASETWTIGNTLVGLGYGTTDTRASIESNTITNFNLTTSLKLTIDGTLVTINLSPATSGTVAQMVTAINAGLAAASTPRLATAVASGTTNDKITIETTTKAGPFSSITVTSAGTLTEFAGKSGVGEKTVLTTTALTAAAVVSGAAGGGTINTSVVYASARQQAVVNIATGSLYNVSKLIQEASGSINIMSNAFTAGTYNSMTVEITSVPAEASTITFTRADAAAAIVFTWRNPGPALAADEIAVGVDEAACATLLADMINDYSGTVGTDAVQESTVGASADSTMYPSVGVRASAVGAVITLTQIHPNATFADFGVTVTGSANYADVDNGVDAAAAINAAPVGTDHTLKGGTTGSYVRIWITGAYTTATDAEGEVGNGIDYFFMADADFVTTGETITDIATSLAAAITNHGSYQPTFSTFGGDYVLGASANSNTVTIESILAGGATGGVTAANTGIAVVLDNSPTIIVENDLGPLPANINGFVVTLGGTFQHGFAARAAYQFANDNITIDGTQYGPLDFDSLSSTVLADKHEATLQEVADALNTYIGEQVASVSTSGGFEYLWIISPTPGTEGSVSVTLSDDGGAVTGDPFQAVTLVSPGTGDCHLVFTIDDTYDVDVTLTQDTALALEDVAAEINAAATAVDSSLAGIATVTNTDTKITITSPTSGNFADFGSRVEVTNALGTFITVQTVEGTGTNVASTTIKALSTGTWANDTVAVVFSDEDALFYAPNSSKVDVYYNGVVVESYREVVVNPAADGTSGTSGQGTFIEDAINGVSDFVTVDFDDSVVDTDPDTLATSTKFRPNTSSLGILPPYELTGGNDGITGLTDGEVIGVAKDTTTGLPTGIQVFANTETLFINLLAAPGFTSQAVGNALVTAAEARQDTLALIDPPMGLDAEEMVDWHNGLGNGRTAALNTSFAATYNTWLEEYDPYNDQDVWVPPSSFVLAQMAYNDSVAEPWFATAGLTRGRLTNALDVLNPTTLGDRELLYGQGNRVNPIPKFVQEGIVIWGNRTLYRQESALKEITVRRLLNYAKVAISLGAKVILFEPNDPSTSNRLLNIVNPVLYSIRVRRGLSAFKVVDATTDRDRNLNRLVLKIFLQPTRTVEVIEIPFVVTAAGGSFSI